MTMMKNALFLFVGNLQVEFEEFECRGMDTHSLSVLCKSHSSSILQLPDYITYNVRLLFIDARNGGTLAITEIDIFRRFKLLKTLEITVSKSLHISEKLLESHSKSHLSEEIFKLPHLECLSVEYEEFNRQNYMWKLPPKMVKFRLSNSVFEYDLKDCASLSGLRLDRNEMNKLPSLHEDAVPFFRRLELTSNPMSNLVADDLASFCRINKLVVKKVPISGCECKRTRQFLKEWSASADEKKYKFKFDTDLVCGDDGNCDKYTTDEANRVRKRCLQKRKPHHSGTVSKLLERTVLHWIVALIMMSSMSSFGLLFI
ncbi:uncharacterized protein LOC135845109 [Planococcus citri]|uniref:uncharacterized protein LOC135845109 n=1 Tax=Planococcus citri TaxID=170843 RepID=UPI0031F8AE3C